MGFSRSSSSSKSCRRRLAQEPTETSRAVLALRHSVAGVGLGGTAINYTIVDQQERFLIDNLSEHPALSRQGPDVCLGQIAEGLQVAVERAGVLLAEVVAVGLMRPSD